jgi:ribosomal protein S18 acetylase RimI-like enzyme
LQAKVDAFTEHATGHHQRDEFLVALRDEQGVLWGGVHAWTWGGCCELHDLWVDPDARGRGFGGELMRIAEDEARRRDCLQMVLFTHAAQAPGLYPDLGYELVGRLDDYPEGDAALWFRKRLR